MTTQTELTPFDSYEISPCTRFENDAKPGHFYFEVCEPAEADVWTLFGHIPGEGVMAIGDFDSREHAEEAFFRITGIPFAGTSEVQERVRVMHAGPRLLETLRGVDRFFVACGKHADYAGRVHTHPMVKAAIAEAEGMAE